MRYRVTIRGEGTEIRGYATAEALAWLADSAGAPYLVVASQADDDYNPFGRMVGEDEEKQGRQGRQGRSGE